MEEEDSELAMALEPTAAAEPEHQRMEEAEGFFPEEELLDEEDEEETVPDPSDIIGLNQGGGAAVVSEVAAAAAAPAAAAATVEAKPKLPPRPADYDYYWYEDDDGNWRNEYDDEGYEFDPEVYEKEGATEEVAAKAAGDQTGANELGMEVEEEDLDQVYQVYQKENLH